MDLPTPGIEPGSLALQVTPHDGISTLVRRGRDQSFLSILYQLSYQGSLYFLIKNWNPKQHLFQRVLTKIDKMMFKCLAHARIHRVYYDYHLLLSLITVPSNCINPPVTPHFFQNKTQTFNVLRPTPPRGPLCLPHAVCHLQQLTSSPRRLMPASVLCTVSVFSKVFIWLRWVLVAPCRIFTAAGGLLIATYGL